MDCWEKFKKIVEKERLARPGDKILVAVSGGPDSVCLLHLFWRLKKTVPLALCAVTIDHGLRASSAKEARKVEALCKKLSVPLVKESIPVRKHAAANKLSTETAARDLRYKVLEAAARELKCDRIATGHTANDNAETVVMWLIRGTGTDGVSGIPLERRVSDSVSVIRPMLPCTREEVLKYAKTQRLPYSIDASNYSLEYTRNRIRHTVLPMLQKLNPRLIEHLYNFSQISSRDNEFLNSLVKQAAGRSVRVEKRKIILDLKHFLKYNKAIQLRLFKQILPENRSAVNVEFLRDWVLFSSKSEFRFTKNISLKRLKNKIIFDIR